MKIVRYWLFDKYIFMISIFYMWLALITWASSWIWKAFAKQLASEGVDLFLVARRKEKLEQLAKELEEQHEV